MKAPTTQTFVHRTRLSLVTTGLKGGDTKRGLVEEPTPTQDGYWRWLTRGQLPQRLSLRQFVPHRKYCHYLQGPAPLVPGSKEEPSLNPTHAPHDAFHQPRSGQKLRLVTHSLPPYPP